MLAIYKGKVYGSIEDLLLDVGKTNDEAIYAQFGELTIIDPVKKVEIVEKMVESVNNDHQNDGKLWTGTHISRIKSTTGYECTGLRGEHYESLKAMAEAYGIKPGTLNARLVKGMSVEKALSIPIKERRKKQ